jgi:hypothetical protein
MCMKIGWVRNCVRKKGNIGQKHSTAASSPVILWFAPLSEFGYEIWQTCWQHYFVAWARSEDELEIMCDSGEIMVENIVLQLPHLLYCDSSPCQNLAMKFGKRVDSIMFQHPSKFGGMSTIRSRVRNYVWKWRNNGQKHSTAAPSPVVLWFPPLSEFGYEICQTRALWFNIYPNLVAWAWTQSELERII